MSVMFQDKPIEIIILSANNYDSEDISGCSVFYTFDTTMEESRDDLNTIGNIPAKVWAPKELFYQIPAAPAKYEATFAMRVKKNVPTLVLDSVRFINRVKLVDDIASAAPPADYVPPEAEAASPEALAVPAAGEDAKGKKKTA